jgi:hypothetical protein
MKGAYKEEMKVEVRVTLLFLGYKEHHFVIRFPGYALSSF